MAEKPKIFTKIFHRTSKRTYRPPASGGKLYKHIYIVDSGSGIPMWFDPIYSQRNIQQYNDIYELMRGQGTLLSNTYFIKGFTALGWIYALYDVNADTLIFNVYQVANTDNSPSGEDLVINTNQPGASSLSFADDGFSTGINSGSLRVNGDFITSFTITVTRDYAQFVNMTCDIKEV